MNDFQQIVSVASGEKALQVQAKISNDDVMKIALGVFVGMLLAAILAGLILKKL